MRTRAARAYISRTSAAALEADLAADERQEEENRKRCPRAAKLLEDVKRDIDSWQFNHPSLTPLTQPEVDRRAFLLDVEDQLGTLVRNGREVSEDSEALVRRRMEAR